MVMAEKDKSGYYKRHEGLVKKAVEIKKDANKDNSKIQNDAARKMYKASSLY
jgi:hypothetical protein